MRSATRLKTTTQDVANFLEDIGDVVQSVASCTERGIAYLNQNAPTTSHPRRREGKPKMSVITLCEYLVTEPLSKGRKQREGRHAGGRKCTRGGVTTEACHCGALSN